jgi:hypothetical protein
MHSNTLVFAVFLVASNAAPVPPTEAVDADKRPPAIDLSGLSNAANQLAKQYQNGISQLVSSGSGLVDKWKQGADTRLDNPTHAGNKNKGSCKQTRRRFRAISPS